MDEKEKILMYFKLTPQETILWKKYLKAIYGNSVLPKNATIAKNILINTIKDKLEKHSTPANNGHLHTSLDEACKEEIQD